MRSNHSKNKGIDARRFGVVFGVITGLAAYGIAKISSNGVSTPASSSSILDSKRLLIVKYATVDDMKKASAFLGTFHEGAKGTRDVCIEI